MTPLSLIGWAHTPFGKLEHEDVESLMKDVSAAALEHAEISPEDVDGIYVGVFNSGLSRQAFEGALVGMGQPSLAEVPATHLENACASGSAALFAAQDFLASGRGRVALVVGAEKMTSATNDHVNDSLLGASHRRTEDVMGSFAGIFGDLAQRYADRYGDQREALAMIAAKNHRNAVDNPYAHMRRDLGVEFCATESDKNPRVAGPLLRTDCSLVSDGAAAVVIATEDVARASSRSVVVRGRAQVNAPLALARRRDPLSFDAAAVSFQGALDEAGVTLEGLDLLETHDCFTQGELLQYEAFGLAGPGKGGQVIRDGITERGGRLPTNLSGGLKAKGHPVGATGVSQYVMAAVQLAGEAGAMQLSTADRAAVFNMGGVAVTNYASILERAS